MKQRTTDGMEQDRIVKVKIEMMRREVESLRGELQQQKGMMWVLGEVIKIAANIDSFRNLMEIITDMLMGVMGVDTCSIWMKGKEEYTLYFRSIYNHNVFQEKMMDEVPLFFEKIQDATVLEIPHNTPNIIQGKNVRSMLVVPLYDFQNEKQLGMIVAEHKTEQYFTSNKVEFFKTLAICISTNARNSKMFERVSELSQRDPLTKCFNRKHLQKFLRTISSEGKSFNLVVFDLDNFKGVNDTYGHIKGDEVLVAVSNEAMKCMREHKGELIRYGGDEFVMLLFNPLEEAVEIMDTFRRAVPKLSVIQKINVDVTVTIGIASYPDTVQDVEALFGAADQALLDAKGKGKNCVAIGYQKEK